jgi:hypothetical protein
MTSLLKDIDACAEGATLPGDDSVVPMLDREALLDATYEESRYALFAKAA